VNSNAANIENVSQPTIHTLWIFLAIRSAADTCYPVKVYLSQSLPGSAKFILKRRYQHFTCRKRYITYELYRFFKSGPVMPDRAMPINSILHSLRSFIRPPYHTRVLVSKSSKRAAMRGMAVLSCSGDSLYNVGTKEAVSAGGLTVFLFCSPRWPTN
jgi:hypothetical protein